MRVKDSTVTWHLFAPEMYEVLSLIDDIYIELMGDEATLTSGKDGTHMEGSRHYTGHAADFRLPREIRGEEMVVRLRSELGSDFDVVQERDHIHVEYDPED